MPAGVMMRSSPVGTASNYNDILEKVIERDRIDSTRDVAPLKIAPDAVVIDSDQLTADEVFEKILALALVK